jgi:hypothetical protein
MQSLPFLRLTALRRTLSSLCSLCSLNRYASWICLGVCSSICFALAPNVSVLAQAVPSQIPSQAVPFTVPPADQPEEVLRTEVILEARSPINGKPMTATEYVELQARLEAENQDEGFVPPQIRNIIRLLRIRKVLRAILPFF